jgi:hypothetical protein
VIKIVNENLKITIAVLSTLSISYLVLVSVIIYQFPDEDNLCVLQTNFFEQDFDTSQKIILLGSSQTARINQTYISDYLLEHNFNYQVFNLANPGDVSTERLFTLDKTISIKPSLVVYGVGYWDFEYSIIPRTAIQKPDTFLFEPQKFFHQDLFPKNQPTLCEHGFLNSPKGATQKIIRDFFNPQEEPVKISDPHLPFEKYTQGSFIIRNESEILEHPIFQVEFRGINPEHENIDALKKIITKFQENDVKVVLFTTPYHPTFFKELSERDEKDFQKVIENIQNEMNVNVYQIHKEYTELDIWNDYAHIVRGGEAIIVTKDISEIILKEIES